MIHYWVLCGNLEKKSHPSITHSAMPDIETVVTVRERKENETNQRVIHAQQAAPWAGRSSHNSAAPSDGGARPRAERGNETWGRPEPAFLCS